MSKNKYYITKDGVTRKVPEWMYVDYFVRGEFVRVSRAVYSRLKYSVFHLFQ